MNTIIVTTGSVNICTLEYTGVKDNQLRTDMYTQEQRQERIERAVETVGERIDAATCYMSTEDKIKALLRIKYEVENEITAASLVESTPQDETLQAQ